MTTSTLREAIKATLRRRSPKTVSMMLACDVEAVEREITAAIDSSPDEDIPCLAELIGLRADGSDPAQELDALRDQLAAARAALIDSARKCEHRCGDVATIRAGDEMQDGGAFRYCDKPACRGHEPVHGDLPHAAALRAARGAR
jgi:hypothetical protein